MSLDRVKNQIKSILESSIAQHRNGLGQLKSPLEVNHRYGFIEALESCLKLIDDAMGAVQVEEEKNDIAVMVDNANILTDSN